MPFKEGNEFGKQGRPIGSSNKITSEAREALAKALSGELEGISKQLERITDPKDRIDALSKLLPYMMPKLSSSDVTVEDVTPEALGHFDFTQLPQASLQQIFNIAFKKKERHEPNKDDSHTA